MVYFQIKNPNFGNFLGASNKRVCFFHDHLVYFPAIWYILWLVGIFCSYLVYFSRFSVF
jgi:hypothetical protein